MIKRTVTSRLRRTAAVRTGEANKAPYEVLRSRPIPGTAPIVWDGQDENEDGTRRIHGHLPTPEGQLDATVTLSPKGRWYARIVEGSPQTMFGSALAGVYLLLRGDAKPGWAQTDIFGAQQLAADDALGDALGARSGNLWLAPEVGAYRVRVLREKAEREAAREQQRQEEAARKAKLAADFAAARKVPPSTLLKRAVQLLGLTEYPGHAGYILPDGAMLNLSGGAGAGHSRGEDHRIIGAVFTQEFESGSDAMKLFMARTGAIRVSVHGRPPMMLLHGEFSSRVQPTRAQLTRIEALVERMNPAYVEVVGANAARIELSHPEGFRARHAALGLWERG